MNDKRRKTSMRQVVDEHSPTYQRAVERVRKLTDEPLRTPVEGEPVKFYRGARVRAK